MTVSGFPNLLHKEPLGVEFKYLIIDIKGTKLVSPVRTHTHQDSTQSNALGLLRGVRNWVRNFLFCVFYITRLLGATKRISLHEIFFLSNLFCNSTIVHPYQTFFSNTNCWPVCGYKLADTIG